MVLIFLLTDLQLNQNLTIFDKSRVVNVLDSVSRNQFMQKVQIKSIMVQRECLA